MNESFNWFTAIAIFIGYFVIDWLMAYYTMAVVKNKEFMAAHSGAAVYLLTSYGVINYTQNWWYILFIVAGSWLGTYVYVKRRK